MHHMSFLMKPRTIQCPKSLNLLRRAKTLNESTDVFRSENYGLWVESE